MKKNKKVNALIAAGCLAFLVPSVAQAAGDTLGNVDVSSNDSPAMGSPEGATFETIKTSNTAILTLKPAKNLVPADGAAGTVEMSDTSKIIIDGSSAPGAPTDSANITFTSTTIKGTNIITQQNVSSSSFVSNLGTVGIDSGKSLTIDAQGGSITAGVTTMASGSSMIIQNTSTSGSTPTAITLDSLKLNGSNTFTNNISGASVTNGVTVSGQSNSLTSVETITVGGVTFSETDAASDLTISAKSNIGAVSANGAVDATLYLSGATDVSTITTTNTGDNDAVLTVTRSSVAAGKSSKFNTAVVNTGSTLNLQAAAGQTLDGSAGTAITLNGNLNVQGAGTVKANGVNVDNATAAIGFDNQAKTTARLGNIGLTEATVTFDNATAGANANIGEITLSGSNILKLKNSEISNLEVAQGESLSINGVGNTSSTFANVTINAGADDANKTSLVLDSQAGNLSGGSVSMAGNSLVEVKNASTDASNTNTVTLQGLSVSGTGNTVDNQSANDRVLTVTDGITFADGATNSLSVSGSYNLAGGITSGGTDTLTLSGTGETTTITVNDADGLTIEQTAGTTTFNTAAVGAGSTLTVNADTGASVDGSAGTAVTLNGNLNVQGAGTVKTNGLNVGTTAAITFDNDSKGTARLGAATLNNSTLSITNAAKDNITSIAATDGTVNNLNLTDSAVSLNAIGTGELASLTLDGSNSLYLTTSVIPDFTTAASQTTTLVGEGSAKSTFGTATLAQGSAADKTTLVLDTTAGSLEGAGINMAGNSAVEINNTATPSNTNTASITGNLVVSEAGNVITNNGSSSFKVNGVTQFTDGVNSDLTINGAYNLAGGITSGGTDTLTLSGTGETTTITVNDADSLTIEQTAGTTTFNTAAVGAGSTLTVNADTGASVDGSAGTAVTLNGNLNVQGAGTVKTNGINVGTTAAITIDSAAKETARLGAATLNNSTLVINGAAKENITSISATDGTTNHLNLTDSAVSLNAIGTGELASLTLDGSNSLYLTTSVIPDFTTAASQTTTLVGEGSAKSTFGTATLNKGSDSTKTKLVLDTTAGSLEGAGINMAGNSAVEINNTATPSNTNTASITGNLVVSEAGNIITNNGSSSFKVNGVTQFTDGVNSDLTINGAYNLAGGITSGRVDTVTFNGSGELGDIVVNLNDKLTLAVATGKTLNSDAASLKGGATLVIDGEGQTSFDAVEAVGAGNIIDNAGTNTTVANNLGDVAVGISAGLTINSKAAVGTELGEVTLAQGTELNKSTLELKAISGDITASSFNLNGNSSLTLSGSNDILLETDGVTSVTGSGNVISNSTLDTTATNIGAVELVNAGLTISNFATTNHEGFKFTGENTVNANNVDFADFTVSSGDKLTVNADGATSLGDVTMEVGDTSVNPFEYTGLNLNATVGTINTGIIAMNGMNNVAISGDNVVDINGVNINGGLSLNDPEHPVSIEEISSNVISSTLEDGSGNSRPVNVGPVTFAEDGNLNAIKLQGAFDVASVTSGGSDTLAVEGGTEIDTLTINKGDTVNLTVVNNTSIVNVTGTSDTPAVTMKGAGAKLHIRGNNGAGSAIINGVKVLGDASGVTNSITNEVVGTKLGALDLEAEAAETVGSLTVDAKANTEFSTAVVKNTTLSLNADSGATLSGTGVATPAAPAVALKDNSELDLSGAGTINLNGISVNGTSVINSASSSAKLGAISMNNAGTDLAINASSDSEVEYSTASLNNQSELTLNADGGAIESTSTTSLQGASTITLTGDGAIELDTVAAFGTGNELDNQNNNASIGNIDVKETNSSLNVSATGNLTYGAASVDNSSTLILNAAAGTITSTGVTTLDNGSALSITGTKDVALSGVTIADSGSKIDVQNANADLGTLTIGDGTEAINFSTTDGTISSSTDDINVGDLVLTPDVNGVSPSWNLDVKVTQDSDSGIVSTSDKIVLEDGANVNGKLNIGDINFINTATDKFVQYVELVDSANPDATAPHVLNSTGLQADRYIVTKGSVYYSYYDNDGLNPEESKNYYAPNTIRVTNYNISSDHLLDNLTRRGIRELVFNSDDTHNVAKTGISALPNMEALAGINNVFTVTGIGVMDGRQGEAADSIKAQMFTVDTTDGIARTLNLNGFSSYQNALSDSSRATNSGNGAVIHTVSNADTAAATVNIASFAHDGVVTHPTFQDNIATGSGAVIYNDGIASSVNIVSGTNAIFKNNKSGETGGVITNINGATVSFADDTNTTFTSNSSAPNPLSRALTGNGGVLYNDTGAVANLNGIKTFDGNEAGVNGGAIYAGEGTVNLDGVQTFTNNKAGARGGAIYAKGNTSTAIVNISATRAGSKTEFSGNTANGASSAIYLDGNATINLAATAEGSSIEINDAIGGSADETNVLKQNAGSVYYNADNSTYAGNFELNAGDAFFNAAGAKAFSSGGSYKLAGGTTMHLNNGVIDVINADKLDLSATAPGNPAKLIIDMDLTKEVADRFELEESATGEILVAGINATGSTDKDEVFFKIADGANVTSTVKEMETPYYMYDLLGKQSGLLLKRGKLSDTAMMAPQVAANARLAGQLTMYDQLLHRVDEIAESRYFNKVNRTNLYASAHDVIDNKYTPYVHQEDGGCTWMKPSITLETISPEGQDGYKNKAYNTILGYETPISTLGNGWELINTVFGGYQGSLQDYDNVDNVQNGGVGGYMANLYKNNFFASGVVMLGATHVNVKDNGKYNRDISFGMYDVGGAARIGYNVGMGEHWLFQPMFTTSYTFISGVDKHNERGESVDMKGTNTIQIAPGFKLVGNYGGWQPYLLFDYTWPLIAKTVANVNNVDLPDVGLRSYIEYGAGFRKSIGDRFAGYAEAVMRNGGRTGISMQGGLIFKF